MQGMTLAEIAKACGGSLYRAQGQENHAADSVEIDSRLVEKDALFIATRGEKADGHGFIPMVEEKGACCVVCEREPAEGTTIPYILVHNSFQALKDIAEHYRKTLTIPVIGITGSVGKTSTKEFIAGVLAQKYQVLKTQGNFNNEIGLPLTILKIRSSHEVAVLEMGISEFGEMHRLSKMARPDICVLTNIGQCHLENLKSQEGILKAKSEIFDFMNPEGAIVVNGDDKFLTGLRPANGIEPMEFYLRGSLEQMHESQRRKQISATDVKNLGLFGSEVIFYDNQESYLVKIKLPGQHMVYNGLAAACVAKFLGLTNQQIQKGIEEVKPVSGRSNIIRGKEYTVIDDCYNANPVSVRGALDLLETAIGRKVAILGDMFELGEKEKDLHGQIGAYAVEKKIDVVICVGPLSKFMFEEAQKNGKSESEIYYFATKEQLLNKILGLLKPEDTILVKASHGMHFEEIIEYL